jgi:hypothetical protein
MGDDTANERLQCSTELDLAAQRRNGKQQCEREGRENVAQIDLLGLKNGVGMQTPGGKCL